MRRNPEGTVTCPGCGLRVDLSGREPGSEAVCSCGRVLRIPAGPVAAGKLSCPGCGAPVAADLASCPWCRAGLQAVSCPACMAMNWKGSRHCSACGERIERPAVVIEDEAPLPCPRCGSGLQRRIIGDSLLRSCASCGGVWIDSETLGKIVEDRGDAASLRKLVLPFEPVLKATHMEDRVTYVPCPACGELMHRFNFGSLSGVVVDACKDHGTWFDRGEIQHCVEFILSGGLEKAARREKENLREKIEKLKSEVKGAKPGRKYAAGGARFDDVLRGRGPDGTLLHILKAIFDLL